MNKGVIFVSAFLFLISISAFAVSAANETAVDAKAYACVENKIAGKCSSLSTEEKIFSLLATGECRTNLLSDSLAQECWPSSGCKVKTTSQAVLALNKVGQNTKNAEDWLLSQSVKNTDVDWFLQVESANATACTATYSNKNYPFSVREDKTLSGNPGSCLDIYRDYWLKVDSSCYGRELKISCQNSFLTSLLYKKTTSQTDIFYISGETHSASGSGTTTEVVGSSCFRESGACNYEATLWAATVLKYRGYNVSSYLPYLVSATDENRKYLPESFLYSLTGNFRTDLLIKQVENKWWAESGDNFYDTAIALLPFQSEELDEKTNAKEWLGEVQGNDGCWQGNLRNTAFLLYSLWPKKLSSTDNLSAELKDCEDSGYFCMIEASCTSVSGSVLDDYGKCPGTNKCCSKEKLFPSCSVQNGKLCDAAESCVGGNEVSSSDTTSSQFCCVGGTCKIPETSQCETNSGICKGFCSDSEGVAPYSCLSSSQICCIEKKQSNAWLIVLLSALIAMAALGIVFRKKLKALLMKFKFLGKGKGRKPSFSGPRFPPTSGTGISSAQRRILPQHPASYSLQRTSKPKTEFDDVLKKLKEIGK
jgi:hypothetical protein